MTNRVTRIVLAALCGAALAGGRCNQEPHEPSQPPPDAAREPTGPQDDDDVLPYEQELPQPMYGVPVE
jgi:hypothetical protein